MFDIDGAETRMTSPFGKSFAEFFDKLGADLGPTVSFAWDRKNHHLLLWYVYTTKTAGYGYNLISVPPSPRP
jgi:hypothetical protein